MTDTTTVLAGDFEKPTREEWDTEVLRVLNRRRPPGTELTIDKAMARLRTTTVDGLTIEPLYTTTDGPALGVPGTAPYTRGSHVGTGAALAWDVRQLHEDPSATATNAAVLEDLRAGGTSVWLRVGEGGIVPADLPEALAGVIAGLAVAVSSTSDQAASADALLAWLGDATDAAGNLGIDPIGFAALNRTTPDLSVLAAYVAKTAHLPGVKPVMVDVRVYDDAGAGDVDQLAYAVATGIEYVRALVAAGVSAADAFGAIEFRVTVNADQFLGIARLRALRRLWSRVGEVLDVPVEARGAIQHAVTSWRMVTRDDPWVNLLRGTIATFAAAVGGAEIITTLPFDTAQGLPNAFSRRMARNTQLVAAEESNLGRVEDPAGGSWYVETLTDDVAKAAWSRVQELEAAGGMAAALAAGTVAAQVGATVRERRKRLSTRKQPVTGVSMFPPEQESPIEGLAPRLSTTAPAGLKPARDSEVFEGLRDRVTAHTKETGSKPGVFLACLGARRDFGPREQFTSNVLLVAGLAHPSSEGGTAEEIVEQVRSAGVKQVILCSSGKVYAAQAVAVADALKKSGIEHVWIAGKKTETGSEDVDSVIDGEVFDGMDVVAFLSETLDRLGVAK